MENSIFFFRVALDGLGRKNAVRVFLSDLMADHNEDDLQEVAKLIVYLLRIKVAER